MSARYCVNCNKSTDDPICARCGRITDVVNCDEDEPLEFEDAIEQVKRLVQREPYRVKVYQGKDKGYV